MVFTSSGRTTEVDKKVDQDLEDANHENTLFIRLVAKKKRFENVNFKYAIFDNCYIRNCVFDSCNFTGCKFVASNLRGSSFSGCTFDYSTFEKTLVDEDILDTGFPGHENLKLSFARSLRINFQQLGDAGAANKAISKELQACEQHLLKSWKSNESYYRKKYSGLKRLFVFFEWLQFKTLDFIWGNGESVAKLIRFVLIAMAFIAICHAIYFDDPNGLSSYLDALILSPQIFLGILKPEGYSSLYLTLIFLLRLITFGFFMSIIIKRFNRR